MQQRYNLTDINKRRLTRNYINYEESYPSKFPNSFINQILINYLTYLQYQNQEDYPKKLSELLETPSGKKTTNYRITFNKALTDILDIKQWKKGVQGFNYYTYLIGKTTYKSYKYNNENVSWTNFTTNILDRFLSLPQPERERIFCLEQYNIIKGSLDSKMPKIVRIVLKNKMNNIHSNTPGSAVSSKEQKIFDVKPYKLEIDDNSNSYYLIGYSKASNSKLNVYKLQCFKLIRIEKCEHLFNTNGELTEKEKADADEMIDKFGAAYIVGGLDPAYTEKSKIRLSSYGYNKQFLKQITRQRPIPTKEPKQVLIDKKTYYDLEFDCSFRQIENYFKTFGKEATILEPESLVKSFYNHYRQAYENSKYGLIDYYLCNDADDV